MAIKSMDVKETVREKCGNPAAIAGVQTGRQSEGVLWSGVL
jgi:hypothetical protein